MASQNDTGVVTMTAGAAIGQHIRVILTSGTLAVADAGVTDEVNEVGTAAQEAFADGDVIGVYARNKQGTTKMVAGAAIALNAVVYGAASGKIDDTASGTAIGVALEAATADGDVIEVLRF